MRRLIRVVAGVALSCAPVTVGHGQTQGSAALENGAIVDWRIEAGGDGPALGLAVPAFAEWTVTAFDEPVTVAMRGEGHSAVDAWQLTFYRAGDTAFARPLRRFRGDASTLGDPVEWDGRVADGPALRPGETVVALFETRDVAGNIDRAPVQEMLVARYAMRAERRDIASVEAERARDLAEGIAPVPRGVPVRGSMLTMTVTDWLDPEGPRASGIRFRRRGKAWVLRQVLPPGSHDVTIQSTRPMIGGARMIPVGTVTAVAPAEPPLRARVKGTGRVTQTPVREGAVPSDDFLPHATVPGRAAVSRPMTHRESGEDRLALASIDPDRPVTLAMDTRKRMALLVSPGGTGSMWPAAPPTDDPPDISQRRVRVALAVSPEGMLTLPHADIAPGSLYLTAGDGAMLEPGRDYAANEAEGRVLLTPEALSRVGLGRGSVVEASYAVPSFAVATAPEAAVDASTWADAAAGQRVGEAQDGAFRRVVRWLFGGG